AALSGPGAHARDQRAGGADARVARARAARRIVGRDQDREGDMSELDRLMDEFGAQLSRAGAPRRGRRRSAPPSGTPAGDAPRRGRWSTPSGTPASGLWRRRGAAALGVALAALVVAAALLIAPGGTSRPGAVDAVAAVRRALDPAGVILHVRVRIE